MVRELHIDVANETVTNEVLPALFVDLDYESGHVRLNSTLTNITFGGNTYIGIGTLGSISPIQESAEAKPQGITLELSGVLAENISLALNEHYQGRLGKVYMAYLNDDYSIIGEPFVIFQGLMDNQTLLVGKEGKVTVSIENMLVAWDKPKVYYYNNADQQTLYPGDRGLEFVEQTAEKEITWGG